MRILHGLRTVSCPDFVNFFSQPNAKFNPTSDLCQEFPIFAPSLDNVQCHLTMISIILVGRLVVLKDECLD